MHSTARRRRRTRLARLALGAAAGSVLGLVLPAAGAAAAHPVIGSAARSPAVPAVSRFAATVKAVEALPYTANHVPAGTDSAFAPATVPDTAPAEDYTSGSIPGSPDHPAWPAAFRPVTFTSTDGARLTGELAVHPGRHPAVLVVHGFNTHGIESVVRWAAMLAHDGYDVLAADQRDFSAEYSAGYGYPRQRQTFGWKEAQDVLRAGMVLRRASGDRRVGVVGFSEGAQNTVLAMALDARAHRTPVFAAGLTFSGPADQATQIDSTAQPPGCTPGRTCRYPVTDALTALVVPPYDYSDPCMVLADAASRYRTTVASILSHEDAFLAQRAIRVPLLNVYAADDPLVAGFEARMMAGEERGHPLQRTVLIRHGLHAYFDDRWWQQKAILTYFARLLPHRQGAVSVAPTVTRTPGGTPLADQIVPLGPVGPRRAIALRGPDPCPR